MNETNSESNELFQIEKILEKTYDNKTKQFLYKVKWLGYPDEECTWEPRSNLELAPIILNKFEGKLNKKQNKNKTLKQTNKVKKDSGKNKRLELDISSIYGNINKDVPKRVIGIKRQNDHLLCLIEWENIENTKKLNSIVNHSIIREKYPFLLLTFYEERIKFQHLS